jgi:hypothetical protein
MKSLHIIAITATLLTMLHGCKSAPRIEPSTGASSTAITSVVDHTTDAVAIIKRDAQRILADTKSVRETYDIKAIPEALDESVDGAATSVDSNKASQFLDRIDSKAQNILEAADGIAQETQKLQTLTAEVTKLEKSLNSLKIALEETRAKALEKLYGYISMFWVIGFILIAAGAGVAFFLNKAYGASLGLIGLLMLGFASAAHYYMQEIAMIGAIILIIGFLTAVGMIVWSTINSKRNATAIREIVEMIQILKETMTPDEQQRIFGEGGLASQVQSDLTKEIIAKVKEQNGFKKLEEARKIAKQSSVGVSEKPTS